LLNRLQIVVCCLLLTTGCGVFQTRNAASTSNDAADINQPKVEVKVEVKDSEIAEEAPDLPKEMNQYVVNQMEYFLGRGRHHMEKYLARAPRYIELVKQTLRDEGVPEDLVYLALIESGFNNNAKSHAKAVGYWQFIKSTGQRYGLKVNAFVDERRDPIKSTVAAARYLKALNSLFGSWHLALAAYNVGENRIKSQVMHHETRDLWELIRSGRLPNETKHYVPKFIAARIIAKHPERYGLDKLPFEDALKFEMVPVGRPISLRRLADNLGVDYAQIKLLNPMFKSDYVPVDNNEKVSVRVPADKIAISALAIVKSQVVAQRQVAYLDEDHVYYRVKRGDNLSLIASRFGTSISRLRSLNDLGSRSRLAVGAKLKVPSQEIRKLKAYRSTEKRSAAPIMSAKSKVHVVRRGDTLIDISKKYGVTLAQIRRENNLNNRTRILVGASIAIPD